MVLRLWVESYLANLTFFKQGLKDNATIYIE